MISVPAFCPTSDKSSAELLHTKLVPVLSYCNQSPSAAALSASKSGSTIKPSVIDVAVPIPISAALCHSNPVPSNVRMSSSDALSVASRSASSITPSVIVPSASKSPAAPKSPDSGTSS